MLTCTYIAILHNNVDNVSNLVNSLKDIQGNFRKEFIFIDDGSNDSTLAELKKRITNLPRSTIITQQQEGPSLCINKAAKLISGDYVQFIEGSEILRPEGTISLINACVEHGTEVAIGKVNKEKIPVGKIKGGIKIIETPLNQILEGKFEEVANIGKSGSIISRNLLEKIGLADPTIYTQNMSLSLRSAKYSKFSFLEDYVTFNSNVTIVDHRFEAYNDIKAIYNFASNHKELCSNLVPSLLKALSAKTIDRKSKVKYQIISGFTKYLKTTTLDKTLGDYKSEFEKLF